MMKEAFIWVSILLSGVVLADQGKSLNLVCPIQKQFACSRDGCKKNPSSVTIKVRQDELGQNYYSRCNSKGCDKYESSVSQSGMYIEVVPVSKSSRLKIDSEDMSFMETISLGLVSLVGYGICEKMEH